MGFASHAAAARGVPSVSGKVARIQIETMVSVKRGDSALRNSFRYSVQDNQLQVEHNSHLIDVAPRPDPEVSVIQTVTGAFWHTADSGEIVLRRAEEPGGIQNYTIHWLRPDHSLAFIESSDGRFVTNLTDSPDSAAGSAELVASSGPPAVFRIDRMENIDAWVNISTDRGFVGVHADSKRVRVSASELFASPHLLVSAVSKSRHYRPSAATSRDDRLSPCLQRTFGRGSRDTRMLFTQSSLLRMADISSAEVPMGRSDSGTSQMVLRST